MKTWRKGVKWVAVVACGLLMSQASRAGVVYDYVTDQAAYVGNPGQAVNVLVYLKEATSGGSSSIITSDGGLLAGGAALTRSATGLPSNPSSITGVTFNLTDFHGPTFKNVAANAANFGEATGTDQPLGTALGNNGGGVATPAPDRVYLGSFQIMPGDGTTTFTLGAIPGGGNTLTNIGTDLDDTSTPGLYTGVGTRTATFTVSVPEPASFALLGGLAVLGMARRRRPAMA